MNLSHDFTLTLAISVGRSVTLLLRLLSHVSAPPSRRNMKNNWRVSTKNYRKMAELKDLFDFLDDITPEDDEEIEINAPKKGKSTIKRWVFVDNHKAP
jgi:hypothetical protein